MFHTMVQKKTRPPIKNLFLENNCLTGCEYPNILSNLNEKALSFIKFVVDCHDRGIEQVKSGDILKHLRETLNISSEYFQKIRKNLVDDKVLVENPKTYYLVPKEIRGVYESLFQEQKKFRIFNTKPNLLHHMSVFVLEIPIDKFENDNLFLAFQKIEEQGFEIQWDGITNDGDNFKSAIFYYKPLLDFYYLILGIQTYRVTENYAQILLKSDFHLLDLHEFNYKHIRSLDNGTQIYKKMAGQICFANNFNIMCLLKPFLDCVLKEEHKFNLKIN
jgi:hypothetical protein